MTFIDLNIKNIDELDELNDCLYNRELKRIKLTVL